MPETASQSTPKNFYLRVLPESERKDLKAAAGVDGIDDEIVLLRVKINAMLEHEPHNLNENLCQGESFQGLSFRLLRNYKIIF